jgi:hypothetical protein
VLLFFGFFGCPAGAMLTLLEQDSIEHLIPARHPHQLNSGLRRVTRKPEQRFARSNRE